MPKYTVIVTHKSGQEWRIGTDRKLTDKQVIHALFELSEHMKEQFFERWKKRYPRSKRINLEEKKESLWATWLRHQGPVIDFYFDEEFLSSLFGAKD